VATPTQADIKIELTTGDYTWEDKAWRPLTEKGKPQYIYCFWWSMRMKSGCGP